MKTTTRWYPVLLLRNALGQFISVRVAQVAKQPRRRPARRPVMVAVQLALF